MFGIKQYINILIRGESLSREQKFEILNSKNATPKLIEYLANRLQYLYIEVLGDYEGSLMDLMKRRLLIGFCWQTTESSIVFLENEDYIERGTLHFEENDTCYHSWICFKFNKVEYVFDPCLDLLCKKSIYNKLFSPMIKARVSARIVREYLIDSIKNPKPKKEDENLKRAKEFMEKFFGSALEKQREYKTVETKNDVNAPMYRHNTGYKAIIENGKIKKLVAHFYRNDG